MNKEQEHLDRITLAGNKVQQTHKETDRVLAKAQKYNAVMEKLNEKNDIISTFRWLWAYKKKQKAMANAKALLEASTVQLKQWDMWIKTYKENF